ncbi:hypothetical protein CWS72_24115 [Telmatospirillum siberiense]|uniref:Uncharacterized protein n=2 Tax=Telmatospirillum siberiense TaxID=382514 RepID=A0A2N3PNK3_9PROT|nr:hypothetical protein CWS72_24115 [Telmatospirillum siberiense]
MLCRLWLAGLGRSSIATMLFERFGIVRSPASISTRATRLGLPPRDSSKLQAPKLPKPTPADHLPPPPVEPVAKLRKCLGPQCGKHFWSEHAGIRLCPTCAGRVSALNDGMTTITHLSGAWRIAKRAAF